MFSVGGILFLEIPRLARDFAIAFALIIVMTIPALARTETGFLDRTIQVEGAEYRYQVYVPRSWSKKNHWPVILFLHGIGERGDDGLQQTDVGMGHAIRKNPELWQQFVIVMPQCPSGRYWMEAPIERAALASLEKSIKEFKGDRDRLYLTGISMGGYGVWSIASHHPGLFAALVPICGGIVPPPQFPELRTDLAGDFDPYRDTAQKIGKAPVWIFHGEDDPTVPVTGSRKMAAALQTFGSSVRYTEYAGVQHNSWDRAYAEPELPAWLLAQRARR